MSKVLLILLVCVLPLRADFDTAFRAFNAGDYGYALTQFAPEAERGSARAQNALGFLYERGLGVAKDAETAAKWYRKAAEQEYGPGEYNYGLLCWRGMGVPQSDADAVKWLERAARHGVALAEFDLGNIHYKEGKGDAGQALAWWRRAADHKVPAAAYNLAYLYAEGPGFAHDYEEAAKWYRAAATQNYPMAQYALGLLYETGRGVKADPVEARMWLELAARGGVKEAREEMNSRQASLSPAQLRAARQRASAWKGTQGATPQEDAFVAKDGPFVRVLNASAPNPRVRLVTDAGPARDQKPRAAGAGFFVNSEGGVVTSLQIVKGCKEIAVLTFQGEKRAEPAGEDGRLGLAVVAIEGGGGDALAIAPGSGGEPPAVEVGYGSEGHSSSANSVIGRIYRDGQRREFRAETPSDAPLTGGPVLDRTGRVVAMSVAGEAGPTLIAGDDLLRFLRANHVPLTGSATEVDDLPEIAAAAKRSLVRVECKGNERVR